MLIIHRMDKLDVLQNRMLYTHDNEQSTTACNTTEKSQQQICVIKEDTHKRIYTV
jgi:hypothetical protein